MRLERPWVPRSPTRLLCAAGILMDPQVSLPIPAAAKFAASAAPAEQPSSPRWPAHRRLWTLAGAVGLFTLTLAAGCETAKDNPRATGTAVGDPQISGRFDYGPRGFHGLVSTPQGSVYIDPLLRGDVERHQSYFVRDMPARRRVADTVLSPSATARRDALAAATANKGVSIAGDLRTYRLALATTRPPSIAMASTQPGPCSPARVAMRPTTRRGPPSQASHRLTIDTRGLFQFDGAGKLLGLLDANGKLWVAWNPLDIFAKAQVMLPNNASDWWVRAQPASEIAPEKIPPPGARPSRRCACAHSCHYATACSRTTSSAMRTAPSSARPSSAAAGGMASACARWVRTVWRSRGRATTRS